MTPIYLRKFKTLSSRTGYFQFHIFWIDLRNKNDNLMMYTGLRVVHIRKIPIDIWINLKPEASLHANEVFYQIQRILEQQKQEIRNWEALLFDKGQGCKNTKDIRKLEKFSISDEKQPLSVRMALRFTIKAEVVTLGENFLGVKVQKSWNVYPNNIQSNWLRLGCFSKTTI